MILLKANSQLNNGNLESHWNISHSLFLCSSPEGDAHLVSLQTVLVKFLEIQQMGKGLRLFSIKTVKNTFEPKTSDAASEGHLLCIRKVLISSRILKHLWFLLSPFSDTVLSLETYSFLSIRTVIVQLWQCLLAQITVAIYFVCQSKVGSIWMYC